VGAVLGLLGVYVLVRRMEFLPAALSQVAGLGVALALSVEAKRGAIAVLASPTWTTLGLTLLTAALLSSGRGDEGPGETGIAGSVSIALLIAALVGAVSGFVGYVVAFLYELPVAASQALAASGLVLAAELVKFSLSRFSRPASSPLDD
jgi:ABC-type Mn2+/Zn2+ transport system permease subunit